MSTAKVCFATLGYPPAPGGVAQSADRVVRYLVEEGFDVHVFTPTFGQPQGEAGRLVPSLEQGVSVYRIPWDFAIETSTNILALYSAIQDIDASSPFDLFHGYYLPFAYPCILVAGAERPVIASIRGNDAVTGLCSPETIPLINIALQKSSWITSVSTDLLAAVSGLADLTNRSSVIPNSIDPSGFPKWRLTEENRGVVGTIGTRPKKALPLLVQAYAGIESPLRKQLRIIGHFDKKEQTRVSEVIDRYALGSEVYSVGAIPHDHIPDQLLSLRVFVQCSDHDGLPNAVLEAAAAGVPVVATNVGGMKDILRDGESALLVPRKDAKALAAAITEILSNDALAHHLSHGISRLAQQFSPASEKKAWIDLCHRHLSRP